MEQNKILNIVEFSVADKVGNSKSVWTQMAVFYADGTVQIKSVEEGRQLAETQKIKIQHELPQTLEKKYQQYRMADTENLGLGEDDKEKSKKKTKYTDKLKGIDKLKGTDKLKGIDKLKGTDKSQSFFSKIPLIGKLFSKDTPFNAKKRTKKAESAKKKTKRKGLWKKVIAPIALVVSIIVSSCGRSDQPLQDDKVIEIQNDDIATYPEEESFTVGQAKQLLQAGTLTSEQIKQFLQEGMLTNDDLINCSFQQLLDLTVNETQKREMQKVGNFLDLYNGTFAAQYLEQNFPNIRTALTKEEVNALNLVYNNFTDEELKAIFNGYDVNSIEFTNAYKEANLQLFAAFVVSDREHSVPLETLVNDAEGVAYIQNYKDLYYDMVEATGQAKIDAANRFWQEVFKDYSIRANTNGLGSSYEELYDTLEPYKMAATPIILAAKEMSQNLEIDPFSENAITYFEDLGLCDAARETFVKVEQLTLGTDEDKQNPSYQQFMETKAMEQELRNIYYKDDKSRDLSQLDAFQARVNLHFNFYEDGNLIIGDTMDESIITVSDVEPVVTEVSDTTELPENVFVEEQSNNQVNQVSQDTQQDDDVKAYRKKLKKQADKVAAEIEREENQGLEDVEESITPSDDTTSQELPDSEVVVDDSNDQTISIPPQSEPVVSTMPDGDVVIIEYEEPVAETPTESQITYSVPETDGTSAALTNEQIADAIVEDMAINPTPTSESEFVYVR